MKQRLSMLALIVVVISTNSCKKHCKDCWTIPPVSNTYFKITKNSIALDDSLLSKTVMYYINKEGQIVTDPDRSEISSGTANADDSLFMYIVYDYYSDHPEEFKNSHIAMFSYPTMISARTGIQNFYLKYPDGDIDTLFIKAEEVSQEQGKKENCYCTTPVRELKFNGHDAMTDTNIHLSSGDPVYLFEK